MPLVRPTLATYEEIDTALKTRYASMSIVGLAGTVPVPVYLEIASPTQDRTYPRVTVELLYERESTDELETGYSYESAYNGAVSPPRRTMTLMPEPTRLVYQVTGWVKNDTKAFRSLLAAMRARSPRKSYLSIPKTAPADVERALWTFQEGDTTVLKVPDGDELIWQGVWTYSVLAELDRGASRVEKVVKKVKFGLWQGVDKDEKYRSFEYDDTTFTPGE